MPGASCGGTERAPGAARLSPQALLPARFLPGVDPSERLRLQPLVEGPAPVWLGLPSGGGWQLARLGGGGPTALPLAPEAPLVLSAHANGQPRGEAVVDPGLPRPEEAVGLWRAADPEEGARAIRLVPQPGSGRTRAACLWLLAPETAEPKGEEGVVVAGPEPGPGGRIWRVLGQGRLAVAGQEFRIVTGSEEEPPEAQLHALGRVLPRWRLLDGGPVLLGPVEWWGALGTDPLMRCEVEERPLPRVLGGVIAAWRRDGETVARVRAVRLPQEVRLHLQETAAGQATLTAQGLGPGWHVALLGGGREVREPVGPEGSAQFVLAVDGAPPGLVRLRLSEPSTGAAIIVEAPWPARTGVFVGPEGRRLGSDRDVSMAALPGWRAVVPAGASGALQVELGGHDRVAVQVAGEVRLGAHLPLIQAALARRGPDDRVSVSLIATVIESPRLRVGRYDAQVLCQGGLLRHGPGRVQLHAVPLDGPPEARREEFEGDVDLRAWLGDGSGLWLVQGRSDRLGVLRAVAWTGGPPGGPATRESRIAAYAGGWWRLMGLRSAPAWERAWDLIRAVQEGGDCGALDQVQALGRVPEAAVALLLRAPAVAEALALEDAAPFLWPLVPVAAWTRAMEAERDRLFERHRQAEFSPTEAGEGTERMLARRAGAILTLRPELREHLRRALRSANLKPVALVGIDDRPELLFMEGPAQILGDLAQELVLREPWVPDGTAGIRARHLAPPLFGSDRIAPLLHAPFVAAEAAAGLRPPLDAAESLRLLALRLADPLWFDAALPNALALAGAPA